MREIYLCEYLKLYISVHVGCRLQGHVAEPYVFVLPKGKPLDWLIAFPGCRLVISGTPSGESSGQASSPEE